MTRKMITLRFNNTSHTVTSNESEMFNLNTLHKISGAKKAKQPNEWLRNSNTQALVIELSKPENPGLVVKRGGNAPGSWANEQVVYAYASWISPEFHAAVIEAFTALANNNVKKAKEIVAAMLLLLFVLKVVLHSVR